MIKISLRKRAETGKIYSWGRRFYLTQAINKINEYKLIADVKVTLKEKHIYKSEKWVQLCWLQEREIVMCFKRTNILAENKYFTDFKFEIYWPDSV